MFFVLSSLYLVGAKAQMQTIIRNDFPRSLYKHAFRSPPVFFLGLTAAHFECSVVLLDCLGTLRWTLKEEVSQDIHSCCEECLVIASLKVKTDWKPLRCILNDPAFVLNGTGWVTVVWPWSSSCLESKAATVKIFCTLRYVHFLSQLYLW